MRRLAPLTAVLLLASCRLLSHTDKAPVAPPAACGAPLAAMPSDPAAMDAAQTRGLWVETFGAIAIPADAAAVLKETYARDLAAGKPVSASQTRGGKRPEAARFAPGNITLAAAGKEAPYWAAEDAARAAELSVDLGAPVWLDRIWLEEPVELGARTTAFEVDARIGGAWKTVGFGQTIGARKIIHLSKAVEASALRLRMTDSAACPALRRLGAFLAPAQVRIRPDKVDFLDKSALRMEATGPCEIRYTLDGTEPKVDSPLYSPASPPSVSATTTVHAAAFAGGRRSPFSAFAQVVAWPKSKLRPAGAFALPLDRGLTYACFEGADFKSLEKLRDAEPAYAGVCGGFSLDVRKRSEAVAVVYEGWIKVDGDDLYAFTLMGNDGAALWVDGDLALESSAAQSADARRQVVGLCAGWHPIRVAWFNNAGDAKLEVKCFGPGFPEDGKIAAERLGR